MPVDAVALAAKQRDRPGVLIPDLDVVDTGAPAAAALDARGAQQVAGVRRRDVVDRAALRDRVPVVAVAGEGERAVGEEEDVAAVADRMTVEHVGSHGHRELGAAGRDALDAHAQRPGCGVVREHRAGDALGERLGFLRRQCRLALPGLGGLLSAATITHVQSLPEVRRSPPRPRGRAPLPSRAGARSAARSGSDPPRNAPADAR